MGASAKHDCGESAPSGRSAIWFIRSMSVCIRRRGVALRRGRRRAIDISRPTLDRGRRIDRSERGVRHRLTKIRVRGIGVDEDGESDGGGSQQDYSEHYNYPMYPGRSRLRWRGGEKDDVFLSDRAAVLSPFGVSDGLFLLL